MADFVISPLAVSFESIKNNLQTYVINKPENERWKDFYASSAGETIIEIAAALGAFYAYHTIIGRRESYLPLAENYTSVVGLAENNGYSCDRGTNLQLSINIVPNQTVTLPKWSVIGSYAEYDIVLIEDVILNNNIATNVKVIIGNLLNEDLQVTTNKLTQFSFLNANTTETFRLLLNGNEVPTSTEIKDLLKDKYCTLTNVYGAFDTFYLQAGDYTYTAGDTLTSQFIERNNLNFAKFSPSNLDIDYAHQVNEVTLIKDLQDIETKEQIKLKAPLYHETSMVIRSRKDYSKYLLLANDSLIQANDRDINPGLIELTYLKKDYSVMTEAEKEFWLDAIEEARPSGVARASIADPIQITKNLNISLWKANNQNIPATINQDIDTILANYNNSFEFTLDLNQLEHEIEQLSGIKIARVNFDIDEWEPLTSYKNMDIVEKNGSLFYVYDFQHKSGETEPVWPEEIGDTVVDNEIVWVKVKDYESTTVHTWHKNMGYSKFDYIRKDVLTDGTYANSGPSEPLWGPDTIIDNNLVWTLTDEEGELSWSATRAFFLDDIIKVVKTEMVDDEPQQITYYYKVTHCYKYEEAHIFMVQGFVCKSGDEEPEWDSDIIYDGKLVWTKAEQVDNYTTWEPNHGYSVGDSIQKNDSFYIVSAFIGTSGDVEPDWENPENINVYDGDVVWAMLDTVKRTYSIPWNTYLNLTKTYEIVG